MLAVFNVSADVADGSEGSLRDAITRANDNDVDDVIILIPGTYTLSLEGSDEDENKAGDLDLTKPNQTVTIRGNGNSASETVIDAAGNDRVLDVFQDVHVVIQNLTVTGGETAQFGGGLRNQGGIVTISDSWIQGNKSQTGGGIFNGFSFDSVLNISNSTISTNTSLGAGGGLWNGMGSVANLTNVTVSNNSASNGGGIYNTGTNKLLHATLTGNNAGGRGGGIDSPRAVQLRSTIVAGNHSSHAPDIGTGLVGVVSSGYNLIGDASGIVTAIRGFHPEDQVGNFAGQPAIDVADVLDTNLGSDGTHALTSTGPAIDAADPSSAPATDQRGNDRQAGANPDVGAVESQATTPSAQFDFGDAPTQTVSGDQIQVTRYPTLLIDNGARHAIVPGFFLGTEPDREIDGLLHPDAQGDDSTDADDEDGITFDSPLFSGGFAEIAATASDAGKLDAWIDFHADGDWDDPVDQIFNDVTLAEGTNRLTFRVPNDAVLKSTFARFRFSSAGGLGFAGPANDGEVEDYVVDVTGPTSSIRGHKFHDLNGDGARDGEPGLADWVIYLDENNNGRRETDERSTMTDDDGSYEFTGLAPGKYIVREQMQSGWLRTTPGHHVEIAVNGQSLDDVDLGNFMLATISGQKFEDIDGDGRKDANEPGLDGWDIRLIDSQTGASIAMAVTDDDGNYRFIDVGPGSYRVYETPGQRPGFLQTFPSVVGGLRQHIVNITTSGQQETGLDFGNFEVIGSISGVKFHDLNRDTLRGVNEPGLEGWTIFLDTNGNDVLDAQEPTTVTAADGSYRFDDLAVDSYRIREVPQTGWQQTAPVAGWRPVTITTTVPQVTGQDFGNAQINLGSIRGVKFHDVDRDTLRDLSEPGLESWIIYLDANDNGILDEQEQRVSTAADGSYRFENLVAGRYIVREVAQPQWLQTTPLFGQAHVVDISANGDDLTADFGNAQLQLGSISGVKFHDLDRDGQRDGDEPGLEHWTIYLDTNDSGALDFGEPRTTTAADGSYHFANLIAGSYVVREVTPSDWTQTFPLFGSSHQVTISLDGEHVTDQNFGNAQVARGSISGVKFHDVDGDGQRDAGETGLEDWTIFLDANNNSTLDPHEPATLTTSDGSYSFTDLVEGSYQVRELLQPGWTQTSANPTAVTITSIGESFAGLDFGNTQSGPVLQSSIEGVKFHDLDGDGMRDAGEPGLGGWLIYLDANGNNMLDANERGTITDADGLYSFGNLVEGTYRVREVSQAGWDQTTVDPADVVVTATTSGQVFAGGDFGNFQRASIAGVKFHDLDGDGMRDAGEPGLPGWLIYLDANGNNMLDANERGTITDADGLYSFGNLVEGTYRVREVSQAGWDQTTVDPADVVVTATTSVQVFAGGDFGNFQRATIAGVKFHDLDGDGMRDAGEPGLAGWLIYLDANGNNMLDANERGTITDADGLYSFGSLADGTYRVREVSQVGWDQTTVDPADVVVAGTTSGQVFAGGDFGNFQRASIAGVKFHDLDGDGMRDAGEPGLAGWLIYLDANGNNMLDANERGTITDADGLYSFGSLADGTYRVREVSQVGWEQTTANPADLVVAATTSGQVFAGGDFGNFQRASIAGVKFHDLDGNGRRDAGEPGLPAWLIYLDANGNNMLDDSERGTITDADGLYRFGNLIEGTYRVREVSQVGWEQTTANPADLVVAATASGQVFAGGDFGNFQRASIASVKFHDLDGDGMRDAGEPGLPGWLIYLDTNGNNMLDANERGTITDADGLYSFGSLADGTYRVREVSQVGWDQTTVDPADVVVAGTTSGQVFAGGDFGNFQRASIAGVKFHDLDGDGMRDAGEPGLAGWLIYLDANGNNMLDANERGTITDADGLYSFGSLADGTYRVREVSQVGWEQTTANPADLVVAATTSGQVFAGGDFGNFQRASIASVKFHDLDGDGMRDAGEPGLPGWLIYLDANSNNMLDANERGTITDADGLYSFGNLVEGTYRVREVSQAGWDQTTVDPADVVVTATTSGQVFAGGDFGNFQRASIAGVKFHDLDGDGMRDAGEPGLPGWTIELDRDADGTVDATAVTGSDGRYSFPELGPGVYRVREVLRSDWVQTTADPEDTVVTSGVVVSNVDFGNRAVGTGGIGNAFLARIVGVKFHDRNENGVRDPGEEGLPFVRIYLDQDGDGTRDPDEPSTLTSGDIAFTTADESGQYSFNDLRPGTYPVAEEIPAHMVQTSMPPVLTIQSGDVWVGRSGLGLDQ